MEIDSVLDIQKALQKYYETGPFQCLRLLQQLSKANIPRDILEDTKITSTVATLSKKLANYEDEDDRGVAEFASKLTVDWKKLFQ